MIDVLKDLAPRDGSSDEGFFRKCSEIVQNLKFDRLVRIDAAAAAVYKPPPEPPADGKIKGVTP